LKTFLTNLHKILSNKDCGDEAKIAAIKALTQEYKKHEDIS